MKKLEEMLTEFRLKNSWGEITIILKEGKPVLLRKLVQEKVEEESANETRTR